MSGGFESRPQRSTQFRPPRRGTGPPRTPPQDREDRHSPRVGSTVRPRRSSSAQSLPFGLSARPRRSHAHPRTRRTAPRVRATGGLWTRRVRPTWCQTRLQSVSLGNHPATTWPDDCPSGRSRTTLPCASSPTGLLGTTRDVSPSASAISSMTSFNTENRSARMTASAPSNALRLLGATTAAPPIAAASFRADSWSALESWRVSPPAAS